MFGISIQNAGSRTGQIELVEPMGLGTILHIRTLYHTLKSFVLERADYSIGTSIAYSLPAARLHVFDAQTGQRIAEWRPTVVGRQVLAVRPEGADRQWRRIPPESCRLIW